MPGDGKFSGDVVGEVLAVGKVENPADESALFRGNGNSRGGGIGRMLVAPSCSVDWGVIAERILDKRI